MNAADKYEKLQRAGLEIERIASLLDLRETTKNELQLLYLKLIEKKATQGRETCKAVGALLYYLAKRDGMPYTMAEIAGKLETNKWALFNTYKGVLRKLKLSYAGFEFESLIFKYNNELKLQEKTIGMAVEMLRKMEFLTNMPSVKVATALFLAGMKNEENVSIKQITDICRCSESAVIELTKQF